MIYFSSICLCIIMSVQIINVNNTILAINCFEILYYWNGAPFFSICGNSIFASTASNMETTACSPGKSKIVGIKSNDTKNVTTANGA